MTETMSVEDLAAHGHSALAACAWSLRQVGPDDLGRATPCTQFTIAGLTDHLTMSMTLLAGAGGSPPESTADADALPAARILPLAEHAVATWLARGVDGEVPVGSRTLPAGDVYSIVLLELLVHGWDLARALGVEDRYQAPEAVVTLLRERTPVLIRPEARGRGFADAVAVGPDATDLQRLLAFTGRAT